MLIIFFAVSNNTFRIRNAELGIVVEDLEGFDGGLLLCGIWSRTFTARGS